MCGIAGMWSPGRLGPEPEIECRLVRMVDIQQHRGPDGRGTWTDGQVGLGHARLAVIDLSEKAAQPMADATGSIHLTYNGEIYNFRELRDELEGYGHKFRSTSDTEVIIEGYRRWGDSVLERLSGMFAFALWDARRKRLLLARDRFGEKPLYYGSHGGDVFFASEIKAILVGSNIPRKPCFEAISHYLTFQYVPIPLTAFEGIRKLPPGHLMIVSEDGVQDPRPYWTVPRTRDDIKIDLNEHKERIVGQFDEAVKSRMISDVPLGAFLSGGVDSASVVASMARQSSGTVKTFTIGFDEPAFDERAPARLVAKMYGTDHHEQVVRPDVVDILPKLVWHYGEPFSDSSALPTYCVASIARQNVTVALNGDGGDETFLGYSRYAAAKLDRWLNFLPDFSRGFLGKTGRTLPFGTSSLRPLRYLKRFLSEADYKDGEKYGKWIQIFGDPEKQALAGPALREYCDNHSMEFVERWYSDRSPSESNAAYADMNTYLPDDLLVKVDVATMAHSLESRAPFLDHELTACAAEIPAHIKMRGLQTKSFFKATMADRLPQTILSRPKMGFGVPIDKWFRNELSEMTRDFLLSDSTNDRGIFAREEVSQIIDDHMAGHRSHQYRLWSLLFLELWFRTWIDPAEIPIAPDETMGL